MLEIKGHAFYTRADLSAMLEPAGVDVDTFIARLRPRKVFHRVFWGEDIIEAMRKAPSLADKGADETVRQRVIKRRGRRRRPSDSRLDPLTQIAEGRDGENC